ncbi:MAG: VOC family protein [Lysobacterales bacterium]|jgi:predicted enzyme related to lactoylglutathione lyase
MAEFKSAVNWFAIPAADFERAVRFYGDAFGYELPVLGKEQTRMAFFQHQPGAGRGGAVAYGEHYQPSVNGTRVYLNAGPDLSPVLSRVEDAGGTVVMGKARHPRKSVASRWSTTPRATACTCTR